MWSILHMKTRSCVHVPLKAKPQVGEIKKLQGAVKPEGEASAGILYSHFHFGFLGTLRG